MEMKPRSVAILIFEGVELLDFAGPFEVFSAARVAPNSPERLMDVFTVAESSEPLQCNNPLTVVPKYTMDNCPQADILVFLSGERDIRETAKALRKHPLVNTEILPLYARLSAAEQNRIFQSFIYGGVFAYNITKLFINYTI